MLLMSTENDTVSHGTMNDDSLKRKRCECGGRGSLKLTRSLSQVSFGFYHIECEHKCGAQTNRVVIVHRSNGGVDKPKAKAQAVKLWNRIERGKKWFSCKYCGAYLYKKNTPLSACCRHYEWAEVPKNAIFINGQFETIKEKVQVFKK